MVLCFIFQHTLATKKYATKKALDHFDDFYKSIFRLRWPSARLGLLSPQKYVALLNNFGDIEKTETQLGNLGAMDLKTLFDVWERNFKDQKNDTSRQAELDQAFALDRIMDEKARQEEDSDLNFLYPDGSGEKLKGILFSSHKEKEEDTEALDEALEEKKFGSYESDRVIDPDLGIDSGSLHEFVPATKLKGMEDYVAESEYYSYYKVSTLADVKAVAQNVMDQKFSKSVSTVFNYLSMDFSISLSHT